MASVRTAGCELSMVLRSVMGAAHSRRTAGGQKAVQCLSNDTSLGGFDQTSESARITTFVHECGGISKRARRLTHVRATSPSLVWTRKLSAFGLGRAAAGMKYVLASFD